MLLSFFLAFVLALLFNTGGGYAHEYKGFSHDGTRDRQASQVEPDNEEHMKEFLRHSVAHLDQILKETIDDPSKPKVEEIIKLGEEEVKITREMRVGATWVNLENNVYLISIATEDRLITNHPRYPVLYGRRVEASADSFLDKLFTRKMNSDGTDPFCDVYDGSSGRIACGMNFQSPSVPFTLIAGFHHAEDAEFIKKTDCAALTIKTNAKDVYEANEDQEEVLKGFVQAIISRYEGAVRKEIAECFGSPDCRGRLEEKPLHIINKIYSRGTSQSPCLARKDGNLRYKSIYAFIMAVASNSDASGTVTVITNGNNPQLNGLFLDRTTDKEGNNIADVIRKAVSDDEGTPVGGKGGFVTYYWSNPELMGSDATPNWLEEHLSPGTSLKRSYVEVTELPAKFPQFILFIVGSGIYPTEDNDDGACAIAGTRNTFQSALLNLLLIASVLFSVVFLRRRA